MPSFYPQATRLADNAIMLVTRLFHASGGVVYHLRAWRWRRSLWRDYRNRIAAWLGDWQPTASHLVLVGPSGGYTLTRDFLSGFRHVSALEPDPLARRILKRRFPGIHFRFGDAIVSPADLPRHYPDAAYLFCNLLGQDWCAAPAESWREDLRLYMRGREWASFHDVASTGRPPDDATARAVEHAVPFEELIGLFWRHGEIAVEDHDTHGLFPELPRQYAIWNLRPGRFHLVEWLRG